MYQLITYTTYGKGKYIKRNVLIYVEKDATEE